MSVLTVEHSRCTQLAGCELLRWKIKRGQEERHCASSGWGTREGDGELRPTFNASLTHSRFCKSVYKIFWPEITEATGRSQPQVKL